MTRLDTVLLDLAEGLAGARAGDAVRVTDMRLDLPIETRLDRRGALFASTPRGLWKTGFDTPLGRLRATFVRRGE